MTRPAHASIRGQATAAWHRLPERVRFLSAAALAICGAMLCALNPAEFKLSAVETIVLIIAALWLRTLGMAALCLVVGVLVAIVAATIEEATITVSGVLVLLAVAVVSLLQAMRRDRLGLGRVSAESVISQVGRRLAIQGEVPTLPMGWHMDIQQRTADGAAIAGDFVSSRIHHVDGRPVLDVVVVDVSGKGIEAGTRALLLSGAVGGLLGAVPPDDLLPQVNRYLLRQRWSAGFATCVYVRIELETGRFTVRTAGHPAPMIRDVAGQWSISSASGTLLGVLPDLVGTPQSDLLSPGDLLVLLTDGVIEDRVSSLEDGEQRLIDAADRRLAVGSVDAAASAAWSGGQSGGIWDPRFGLAQVLVETVPTRRDDDRAVVVVWRAPLSEAAPTSTGQIASQPAVT